MYTIGQFASIGRVSVRMLRHYDVIGLLRPARVDPHSGYRYYDGAQFAELSRILAFKDLGFTLDQVSEIVNEAITGERLYGMLEERRDQARREADVARARLLRIEARLRAMKGEPAMPVIDVELTTASALRVAQISADVPDFDSDLSPVMGPLYEKLETALARHGKSPAGPAVAYYVTLDSDGPDHGRVHAAFVVGPDVTTTEGYEVVDLPELPLVASTVHHGSMATIGDTWQAFMEWIGQQPGLRLAGPCREIYLVSAPADQDQWVTQLIQPVERV